MFFQPVHQRQVIGQPPHQRHRGMGVQIDQAGNQNVVFEQYALRRIESAARLDRGQQGDDAPAMNRDSMIFQDQIRVDRSDPARLDQQVDEFGSVFHGNRRLSQCGSRVKIANYTRSNQ